MAEESKGKKVIGVIGDVLIVIIMIIAVAFTTLTLTSLKSESGLPSIKGYMLFSVQSNSMEPVFYTGDLLLIQPYNGEDLKVGDIISFQTIENNQYKINTHRIVSVNSIGNTTTYSTMGDNTMGYDKSDVVKSEIVGVYSHAGKATDGSKYGDSGTRISKMGKVMDFLKGKYGFLFCVILPLALIFLYQVYKFIVALVESKKEKALESGELTEEQKQLAIEEYLKKQSEEKAKEASDDSDENKASDGKEDKVESETAENKDEN